MQVTEIIARASSNWDRCGTSEERTLLRLACLRDTIHDLHAERSRLLARGQKPEVQVLKTWETKIEELRGKSPLDGNLSDLLNGSQKAKNRTRLLPDSLFSLIQKEKLERHDRRWESAMAAEACVLGWRFWSIEAQVEIPLVEEWSQRLAEQVWPNGLILFVESNGNPAELWPGKWILLLDSRFQKPEDLNFIPPTTPPPHCKLLFSPKRR